MPWRVKQPRLQFSSLLPTATCCSHTWRREICDLAGCLKARSAVLSQWQRHHHALHHSSVYGANTHKQAGARRRRPSHLPTAASASGTQTVRAPGPGCSDTSPRARTPRQVCSHRGQAAQNPQLLVGNTELQALALRFQVLVVRGPWRGRWLSTGDRAADRI